MKIYEKKPWSREERALLEKYSRKATARELTAFLTNRNEGAIRKKISDRRKRGWRE